jgi:hypothetical protein
MEEQKVLQEAKDPKNQVPTDKKRSESRSG